MTSSEASGTTPADVGTVLVIDDSPENRYAVRRAFVREGFTVQEADTGALALVRAAEDPDLVVLDVNLPDMSGFEVCRRLKAAPRTAHVPVLHLSQTRVDDAARVHGLDGGADAYLTEPVDPAVLVATARALLRMRRAEARLRRELTQAKMLQELAGTLAAAHTADEMAAEIVANAHRVVNAHHTQLGLLDREAAVVALRHGPGPGPRSGDGWEQVPLATPTPMTAVIESGRPQVFGSREAPLASFPQAATNGSGCRTMAVVPIALPDGQVVGALAAAWTEENAADELTMTVLADLALRCGAVLLRGQLQSRRALKLERSELTARVLGELETAGSAAARCRRLIDLVVPALADYAVVEQPGPPRRVLALAHRDPHLRETLRMLREHHALPPGAAHSTHRAAAGESHLIERITPERVAEYALDPPTAALLEELGPRSHISVPLIGGDTVMMLGISHPDRPDYTPADLAYVQELAARAGSSIATARLLEHDHTTAERLQHALLPATPLTHPRLQTASRYLPGDGSLHVGGDWHETLPLPDGRVVVAVGDIVGHGLEAAATMGQVRTAFAVLAPRSSGPADLINEISAFAATLPSARYSTIACAVIDPHRADVTYACAGHPPPILVTPEGRADLLTAGRSPLLAFPVAEHREEAAVALPVGSTLLLYSDGLVERRGEIIDIGLERLRSTAQRTATLPVGSQCDAILTTLTRLQPRYDDIVLLAARLTPAADEQSQPQLQHSPRSSPPATPALRS